jgi:glutamate N-acetyltransferase/amino-acid N-acetyltransferase
MKASPVLISEGGVTSPKGFLAGATSAGIKNKGEDSLDLGILLSEVSCTATAVFTTNRVKAAPLVISRQRLQGNKATALVVNSDNANACTGEQGMADAEEMAELAARHIGVPAEDVLVASTGIIGEFLPMERIRSAMPRIVLSADGGHELARAIITTDTVPKEVAVRVDESDFVIGGMAKGSGMIHPNMATLLCFLTTDAGVDADFLRLVLQEAVDISFNMVSIDKDTSTNDMVLTMANGLSGNDTIIQGSWQAGAFQQALNQVCINLAKAIARDGEGATKLIEVNVRGAVSITDARLAARTIVSSPLVKAAVHGSDPNWGRVVMAVGYSGAELAADRLDLDIGGIYLVKNGCPLSFDKKEVIKLLDDSDVTINLHLNLGSAEATAWGCDLSEEYVTINSEYTT